MNMRQPKVGRPLVGSRCIFPRKKLKKINDCLVLSSRPPPMRLRHGEIQEFVNSYSLASFFNEILSACAQPKT